MELNALTAVSPLDGRYRPKIAELAAYYSEFALIRYRILVEVEYFIALCRLPLPQLTEFPANQFDNLKQIYSQFNATDAERVKKIESTTNHDVKAVEYFIKEKFDKLGLSDFKEFVHFGLTSQDINNTATPLSLKEGLKEAYIPAIADMLSILKSKINEWESVPMLAKTHGQPASPTRLGKEIQVFFERLNIQLEALYQLSYPAKFGGATGNFNAHQVAYPEVDWVLFGNNFVNKGLGLNRSQVTTQIEHYDNLACLFDNLRRINVILIDLCRDIWTYVSMSYFKQKIKKGEVGSSAMPHKVNPIDFENAEGNLGIANAIFDHLSNKLPVSRLQRDLTDSTVLRNIGVPIGHGLIAVKSIIKGLNKLVLNEAAIREDLENNWTVVAEAIQTILRRENYPDPYERLKELTRTNEEINADVIGRFIDSLDVTDGIKNELRQITPWNYTGIRKLKI